MNKQQPEKLLFIFLCAVNCFPIFAFKFFPTLDGVAHLYNVNLINELLFHNPPHIGEYFAFNKEPVPNWLGHFLLLLVNRIMPLWLSEKVLVLFAVGGLAFAFRWFVKVLGCKNMFLSCLIFPFTYSFPLYLGFYNFSIALVLLFGTMAFYGSRYNRLDVKTFIFLLLLISLTYFAHILVFAFLMLMILLFASFAGFTEIEPGSKKISPLKRILFILAAALPATVLFTHYFLSRTLDVDPQYIPKNILAKWLMNIRPIEAFSELDAEPMTRKIYYALILFLGIAVLKRYYQVVSTYKIHNKFPGIGTILRRSDFLLATAVVTSVLYFVWPDTDRGGGYISIRLALFLYLAVISWIALQPYRKWVVNLGVTTILLLTSLLFVSNFKFSKDLSVDARDHYNAGKYIDANSRVLPLKFSDNWFTVHFSNYIGIDKPVMIFDNYEAFNSYFPLEWIKDHPHYEFLRDPREANACKYLTAEIKNANNSFDYIFITGNLPDNETDCVAELVNIIRSSYVEKYKTRFCEVWKRK